MAIAAASAPGKLLLIGEYAVLDGAPALVLAVDRRVRAEVEWLDADRATVDAPQLGVEGLELAFDENRMALCDPAGREPLGMTGRFLPRVVRELGRPPGDSARLRVAIDSGELFRAGADGRPTKLGLGSSAAVCAALATAVAELFSTGRGGSDLEPDPGGRLAAWLPLYRTALGSDASGADLAAALFGGLIEYRSGDPPSVRRLELPDDLQWRAVWTGHSAQTTDFVDAYRRWRRSGADSGAIVERMRAAAGDAVDCAGRGCGAPDLMKAASEYSQLLIELGDAIGIDVMTERHRRLAALATECGAVYKSCGAGGGDLGIAFAMDSAPLDRFSDVVSRAGGVPLNLEAAEFGARPETGVRSRPARRDG
ncbi:MAG: hypothetical protein RQ847_00235 [Wenzhouxiangellaceae bacterium]|nr:hypothetical protein [Wenzhouxiangellaceae bacterium]